MLLGQDEFTFAELGPWVRFVGLFFIQMNVLVIWNQLEHTPFNNGSGPALAKERKRKCLIWVLAWVGSSPLNIFRWWIE